MLTVHRFLSSILLIGFLSTNAAASLSPDDFEPAFNDAPAEREIVHPDWFKDSFLDLREDLKQALADGKQGIALYFGQENCAYCKALMEVNLTRPEIVSYLRDNYEIIPLDIWGSRKVTLFDGSEITERDLSIRENTNFTPSLIFFDETGKVAFRMRGYYKPYRFLAALKYIVEDFYQRESFRDYMERADPPPRFSLDDLNEDDQILKGPVNLDRRAYAGSKPLAVIFEQKECHACDLLHSEPLNNEITRQWLKGFELRQLDAWSDTPVVTPQGKKITAVDWAEKLGIHYMPTTVFFDERGKEIMRIDSVVKLYRMRGVLSYILSGGYLHYDSYQQWSRYSGAER
jgi:thioredoxin-related protein